MNEQMRSQPHSEAGLVLLTVLPDVAKLAVHPLADEYPMTDASEYAGIKDSIRQRGILQPITLFDDGGLKILDGRNRIKAGLEVAHRWKLEDFRVFVGSAAEAEVYVYSINSLRRHQSKEQKEQQVLKLLQKHPNMPSRKLAVMVGVSHTTILKLRNPKEDDGKLRALLKAWDNASIADQEKFAETYKVDLREMLRL